MQTADTPAPASVPPANPDPAPTVSSGVTSHVRLGLVAPLLFFSGMCALVYQVAWLRELRLVFGASTAASAAVLAVFMGGLGVGGWLLGKRADKYDRPLGLYANLELGVAVTAAVTPLLVIAARKLYIAVGGSAVLGLTGATVVRLVLTVVVLGASTFLMGGTLPAAAKAVSKATDAKRRDVGTLYAVNTLGAVTGAFAANFLLLEVFGTRMTLWLACLVNALVGMTARALARRPVSVRAESGPSERVAAAPVAVLPAKLFWFPAAAAGIAGFAFLLMELVWYRMLGPILGGSSYTFGMILCVALLGIGIGGGIYSLFGQNRPATLNGFAWTCALEALCIMIPFAVGDEVAVSALILRTFGVFGFVGHVATWAAVSAFVVLPAAVVSGYQFPLIIALFGSGDRRLGHHVGIAYAANTVGSIAGSLAGGFGLIPLLSAPGCWKGVGALLAAAGLATVLVAAVVEKRKLTWLLPAGVGVLALSLLFATGPTAAWRHSGIGAGRGWQILPASSTNQVIESLRYQRRWIHWEADGVESSVALSARAGYSFIVNGKSDGGATIDAPTQVMGGLIGAALVPGVRRAFVIGLGTGSTAGWLARVREIERVDVAELEPLILRVARDCEAVNAGVMDNTKVHISIGDARELLQTSRQKYDLIFSEPSNPYRAGIASLYTQEFYWSASAALADGGVFLQWLQSYDIDGQTVDTALATLASVFPFVSVWQTQPGDLILVASRQPLPIDTPLLRSRLDSEPFHGAMRAVWGVDDVEGFLAHHVANPGFARRIRESEGDRLNLDDTNLLEYAIARTLGTGGALTDSSVLAASHRLGLDRPDPSPPNVDWLRVDTIRVLGFTPNDASFVHAAFPSSVRALFDDRAHLADREFGYLRKVYDRRGGQQLPPLGRWIFAFALASLGDDAAVPLIEMHRDINSMEATALEARFAFARAELSDAAHGIQQVFVRHRSEPWIRLAVLEDCFSLAVAIVERDPSLAPGLLDSLSHPFAVRNAENTRLMTQLRIVASAGLNERCVGALTPFEGQPVWLEWALRYRLECYRSREHPMASEAESDLERFLSREPTSVGGGQFLAPAGTNSPMGIGRVPAPSASPPEVDLSPSR